MAAQPKQQKPITQCIGKTVCGSVKAVKEFGDEVSDIVKTVKERDPAAKSTAEVFLYSGVHAVISHRIAHKLYLKKHYFSARLISQLSRHLTGIEIHPGATIGKGFFIDHGMGVVIGETAEIGDNCTLYQGVTLGGTGKDVGKRHPTLGDNVMVGAGAKVLGPMTIGSNSKIAANAVVLHAVPENCTAVGMPARVVRRGGVKIENNDLDQIHIPDPVAQELNRLGERLERAEREVELLHAALEKAQSRSGEIKLTESGEAQIQIEEEK